jgi:hypothetical protein
MYYHCTKCGKKYKYFEAPKEILNFGRKKGKKQKACCFYPLRKITKKVYGMIK